MEFGPERAKLHIIDTSSARHSRTNGVLISGVCAAGLQRKPPEFGDEPRDLPGLRCRSELHRRPLAGAAGQLSTLQDDARGDRPVAGRGGLGFWGTAGGGWVAP